MQWMGIRVNNYFNEMCEEHWSSKERAEEKGRERVCVWGGEKSEEVREVRNLVG